MTRNSAKVLPQFTLRFETSTNAIELRTVLDTLSAISGLTGVVSPDFAPGERLALTVRAPEPGSLLIHLGVSLEELLSATATLLSAENLKTVAAVIGAVGTLFSIRKHLGKDPPKVVEEDRAEIAITNSHGVTVNVDKRVFNIYTANRTVNAYLDRTFSALEADPEVDAFEIRDSRGETVFQADRDQFGELRDVPLLSAPPEERSRLDRCVISIVKVSFDPKLRWQFIRRGERIGAYVRDTEFVDAVARRAETFGVGDSLDVDLRVTQFFDSTVGTYVNKEHEVVRVHHHMQAPRQQQFPFQPPS